MPDFGAHHPLDGSAAVANNSGEYGTAGCFVLWGNVVCLLGSAHVLSAGSRNPSDDRIFQPPPSQSTAIQVAQLYDTYPPDLTGQTWSLLDAAIARVSSNVQTSPNIGGLGRPRGFGNTPVSGDVVRIHGAGSGVVTEGKVIVPDDSTQVIYGDGISAWFKGIVRCERYSLPGDSGAAVLDINNQVIGVHLCGTTDYSWFCPIGLVLARWPTIRLIT